MASDEPGTNGDTVNDRNVITTPEGSSVSEPMDGLVNTSKASDPLQLLTSTDVKDEDTEEEKRTKASKKKNKNERRNIKNVLEEENLANSTLEAKAEERERLRRLEELAERQRQLQRQMLEQLNFSSPSQPRGGYVTNQGSKDKPSSSFQQEIIDLSSDEEQEPKNKRPKYDATVDVRSDEEEDDEVVVLSDSEAASFDDDDDEDEEKNDPSVSGMHTDDRLNVPDVNGRVLVNVGHSESEKSVYLADHLANVLKPHQVGGVRFLYDNIVENSKQFESTSGFGCILAHAMGLGKTLQVVSFCDVFLRHTKGRHVLIVVPINTIQNWVAEFDMWLPPKPPESSEVTPRTFDVHVLNETLKNLEQRCRVVEAWKSKGGVLLIGYELYRLLANKSMGKKRKGKNQKNAVECVDIEEEDLNKARLDVIHSALVDPGPSMIICDEGHRIKNCLASISNALKSIKTRRRVVLTGYPLQNNLQEYWCMVDFVRPNFLGTRTEFSNMFERPIANGQCVDSTAKDVRLMRHRAHVLHTQLKGFVQRRGHRVLKHALPTKYEHVLLVRMTPIQRRLYKAFMDEITLRKSVSNPLKAFAVCSKIWNHPDILYNHMQLKASLAADDDLELEEMTQPKKKNTTNKNNTQTATTANGASSSSSLLSGLDPFGGMNNSKKDEISYDWASPLLTDYESGLLSHSPKFSVFMALLEETVRAGDRMLLFSQSLSTLTLIEHFLQKTNIHGTDRPWRSGESYYRLDGSTSGLERERLVKSFNSNPSVLLFIVSTRAGSLGVNLVGANRVVVLDASWNPCHDSQAVCRVYRYGQRKSCHIYRIISDNCIERKIYDRQINKQGMSDRVVDELNPDNHISSKDIASLISHNEKDPGPLEVDFEAIQNDYEPVLSRVLVKFGRDLLTQLPFEHESLLIDRKEKRLTKAEKRLAERTYALEKNSRVSYTRPSYVAFYPDNNTSALTSNITGSSYTTSADYSNNVLAGQRGSDMGNYGSNASGDYSGNTFGGFNSNAFVRRQRYQSLYNAGLNRGTATEATPTEATPTLSLDLLRGHAGVSVQEVTVPKEMVIPTNTMGQPPIRLMEGQKVVVIHTPKGFYLKMEEKIIKVKMPDTMRAAVTNANDSNLDQNTLRNVEES